MSFHHSVIVASILAASLTLGCAGQTDVVKKDTSDQAASNSSSASSFEGTDIDGEDFDLSDHLGQDVIILSFWSTWCEPCKAEMPTLQKIHDAHDGKGLKIVSISLDSADTMAGVKPYIKSNGYTFTVLIDEDTSIAQSYNPRSTLPFMVMLNRKGEIHKQIEGFQLSEADHLVEEVKALVEAK